MVQQEKQKIARRETEARMIKEAVAAAAATAAATASSSTSDTKTEHR